MMGEIVQNNIFTYHIDFKDLTLFEQPIGVILGYPDGQMPDHIKDIFYDLHKQAGAYCSIKGGYRLLASDVFLRDSKMVDIEGKHLHTGRIITKQLKEIDSAALFACTLGPDLERWSKKMLATGEAVKGYIIDAIGSEIVELAMDKIESFLSEQMDIRGLRITSRFSPGYCGWPLTDQHTLFSLLPERFCGISLTPTALMVPVKSISGIIGIGSRARKLAYPCKVCDMKDCIRRIANEL